MLKTVTHKSSQEIVHESNAQRDYPGTHSSRWATKERDLKSSDQLKDARKKSQPPKNKKAIGTPVPYSLENAHEADRKSG